MTHEQFIAYFFDFYGKSGLYPQTLPSLTIEQVKAGIVMRGTNFEGDSFDRESIRDMILVATNRLGGVFEIGLGSAALSRIESA